MQMRVEKRNIGGATGARGVITTVFSWTFGKQYAYLCCAGHSFINGDDNFRYQLDGANKTHELTVSGVWELPVGKCRHFAANVFRVTDKLITGWRADYIFSMVQVPPSASRM